MNFKKRTNKKTGAPTWKGVLKNATAKYAWLNNPSTKFAKTIFDHEFSVTALWVEDSTEYQEIRDLLQEIMDEVWDYKTADMPKKKVEAFSRIDYPKPEMDPDTFEPTGRGFIKAKTKAYRAVKDPASGEENPVFQPLTLVGPDRAPFKDNVYSGAKLNLSVNLVPYIAEKDKEVGLAFYLDAVQVIVNGSGGVDPTDAFEDLTEEEEETYEYQGEEKSATPFG